MNELALFAGAGGGILGGKLLGWGDGNSKEPHCPESGMFEGAKIYTIACPNCGAGVAPGYTLEEAIKNWNQRA